MNILIIGDSWSKPDGYTEPNIPPYSTETYLPVEYYLMSKGHTVFNRGEGGRGNMNSLRLGIYFVKMAKHLKINLDLVKSEFLLFLHISQNQGLYQSSSSLSSLCLIGGFQAALFLRFGFDLGTTLFLSMIDLEISFIVSRFNVSFLKIGAFLGELE